MNLRKKWKKGCKATIPVLAILAAGMMMNMPVQAAEITVEEAEIPAPETAVTSGSCGTNVTWSYDSEAKKLTISGTGKMTDYSVASDRPWHSECANIESVVVGSGVTSIGKFAFHSCSSLSSIELPAGITSIGGYAFRSCSSLSSIELPAGITSIGEYAFRGCSSLSNIDLPSGMKGISLCAFSDCISLGSIDLPSGIKTIATEAFSGCKSLSGIELPASVISIGDAAFRGCSSLGNINLPSGITSIGDSAFSGCSSLGNISLPSGITSIEAGTFMGCSNLSNIDLPSGITSIGNMAFSSCSSLSNIDLPSGITSIGNNVFNGCSSLGNINLPSGITSIEEGIFSGCSNLSNIELPSGITSIGTSAFCGCSSLSSIELPAGITSIGSSAFWGCSSLSSIELPNGITSIGSNGFYGCSSLSSIELPAGITSIEPFVFSGCSSLNSIELPAGITSIRTSAFQLCSSLSSIELPAGITSIGSFAFSGCSKLETVITACSWKSTPLYNFSSKVSKGYNHTGNITVQADDTQDVISIHCSDCAANTDKIALTAPENRIYTGSPIVSVASSTNALYTPNVTYAGANLVDGKPQNAGTYTAIMKANTPQGEKTVSLEYEVEKAASSCTATPGTRSLTYTGQAQELVNAGTANGGDLYYCLEENGSYTTSIPQGTDAETYTVYYKVVGDGNHTDTAVYSVNVTIAKADGIISGEDTYTKTYGDEEFAPVTANHSELELQYEILTGDDVIFISGNNVSLLKAGEATVKVTLPESTNYTGAEKTITITVQKKEGYTTEEINKSYLYLRENADSIDLTTLLPADSGTVNYAVPQTEGDVTYSVAPAIENGILNYTVNAGEVDAQGTVKVTVSSDNYEDFDIILNVKLHDQTPVKVQDDMSVALLNDTLTYGETWSVLEFAQNIFTDEEGNVIEGSLEWKCPDEVPVAGTSYGTWVFTPDDPEYATLEGTVSVTVNKVVPTVTEMPVIAERIYHPMEVPADSELTGGNVSVPGSWSFGEATVLPAGIHTCEVIFTPEDTDNYETVTGTVEVTVTKAAPFIKTMPEASPITYGETLADSTLTDGVVWYSETEELPVGGSFAWEDGDIRPTVAESLTPIYTLIFTPSDSDNYHSVEIISGVQVNKAQDAPDMPADTMSVPFGIRLVDEVTLPENWVWQTEDGKKALKPENPLTVTAVYVGEDKDNYENVTVQITITRTSKEWMFTDVAVKPGHWKYENIKYVYDNEIMNGINGTTQFQPDESLNRAMFATVLYRMAGSPQVTYESVFPDVEEGRYYSEAIVWAKQQGMVTGYGDGTYGVNRNITREQIAKILYEYAAGCGYDVSGSASLESFTDGDQVGDWAEGYIRWAVHTGMIEGKPNDDGTYRIDPKGDATRAECAKMLRYFMVTYQ